MSWLRKYLLVYALKKKRKLPASVCVDTGDQTTSCCWRVDRQLYLVYPFFFIHFPIHCYFKTLDFSSWDSQINSVTPDNIFWVAYHIGGVWLEIYEGLKDRYLRHAVSMYAFISFIYTRNICYMHADDRIIPMFLSEDVRETAILNALSRFLFLQIILAEP